MKSLNTIPDILDRLISLGVNALAAAESYGAAIGLQQNTAARIAVNVYALTGGPSAGPERGKQEQLSRALVAGSALRKTLSQAVSDGRTFCTKVLGLLKERFGNKWSTRWSDAGFAWGSLAIPRDPVPMLLDLRGYFIANPAHEVAALSVTAANCDTLVDAIRAAKAAKSGQKSTTSALRRERNAAKDALRKRLTGLRQELGQLLEPDDERWYQFGFRRPVDGRIPGQVEGLLLQAGTPGEVHVLWDAASLAQNYRVTREVDGDGLGPVQVGLFADQAMMVRGLPTGKAVTIRVSARNAAGESAPAEASIVVP